jgi:hypothetical protein
MFNSFTSSDENKREMKTQERLDILKRAREGGYFDEEGTESADIVSGGVNPCDSGNMPFAKRVDGLDSSDTECWICGDKDDELKRLLEKAWGPCPECSPSTYQRPMGCRACPTCGLQAAAFVDGDCPRCNPPSVDMK